MSNSIPLHPTDQGFEPLVTLKEAGARLGLPYFKVQRAARAGLIPTYSVYNSRRLVRLSEVVAVINGTRQGGGNSWQSSLAEGEL